MKKIEQGLPQLAEGLPKMTDRVREQSQEAVVRARDALKKADTLLGTRSPNTPAERDLSAAKVRLLTWMKRLSLLGAIAAGNAGLYAGAERLGEGLRDGAVAVGHGIRALGEIKPIQVNFGTPSENVQTAVPELVPNTPPIIIENSPSITITVNDPAVDSGTTDATVQEESSFDREERILRESALQIADELQQEGFFEHDQTVTGFSAAVQARLNEMGITGAGPLEAAQRTIIYRYKEAVRDRAERDIEGALRMADRVNGAFGGIDTYNLALEHHRPDLAAEIASRTLSTYRDDVRSIRTDSEYTDDPEGRTNELNRVRHNMFRDIFSTSNPGEVPEVLRHLDQNERRGLASTLDTAIASLEAEIANPNAHEYARERAREQLERLRAGRQNL